MKAALKDLLAWPFVRWLVPRQPVLLRDGERWCLISAPGKTGKLVDWPEAQRSAWLRKRATGWVPSDDLLLRWSLKLPHGGGHDIHKIVELDVLARSPFAASDTVWAYEALPGQSTEVQVVAGSRSMLMPHLPSAERQPEVWVQGAGGRGYLLFSGFGERIRLRKDAQQGRWTAVLLLLACALGAALALTPTVRLYLELKSARAALAELSAKTGKTLEMRQAHALLVERAVKIDAILDTAIDPMDVLRRVTTALPDDAYLRSLQATPTRVTISGETAGAAALMAHLGNQPGVKEVKAPQAASKPLGAQKEQFTIELQLARTAPKPAVPEPGSPVSPAEPPRP